MASFESYSNRLSDLKLTFSQLLQKHHDQYKRNREYDSIQEQIPKKCAVCYENFQNSSHVIGLDCNKFRHVFHWDCLLNWLKR